MADSAHPSAGLADDLAGIVGAGNVLVDPETKAGYEQDWTRRFGGPSLMVVRPEDTDQVSATIVACAARGVAVVTQGGNTGLVGGGVPGPHSAPSVVLSTTRLARLGPVDTAAAQVTASAGATLARVQEMAARAGLALPVDLAARDSATIGGMVATNAGGLHVLRFGSMRTQVVGLEAVLADGSVVSRLSGLVKDNTGFDLSQLLIGSEGTLGVVTAARLRLVPTLPQKVVALLGLSGTDQALHALDALRKHAVGLQAAEVFYLDGMELVCGLTGMGPPLPASWPVYMVVECAGIDDPSDHLFEVLAALDLPESATAVATDGPGQSRLWEYRERHTEAVSSLGVPHKMDVTLPQARLAEFEAAVRKVVTDAAPGSRLVLFGHIGDGNLHVNVVGPESDDEAVDEAVLELVASLDGSISAEHGIGRAKSRWLHLSRSPAELAAMRRLKEALDPQHILNPGVIFDGPW